MSEAKNRAAAREIEEGTVTDPENARAALAEGRITMPQQILMAEIIARLPPTTAIVAFKFGQELVHRFGGVQQAIDALRDDKVQFDMVLH